MTADAEPVVITNPVGKVRCNEKDTSAVDCQATEKSLTVDHHDRKVGS